MAINTQDRPTTAAELLRQTRELIGVRERWTQIAFARNARWDVLDDPNDSTVVCWCLDGAMNRVLGQWGDENPIYEEARLLLNAALHEIANPRPSAPIGQFTYLFWNDWHTTTHRDVLTLVDLAYDAAVGMGV